jgi:cathepsin L
MVDCTATYGNLACDNGESYQAFEYVRDHGIQTATAYPYIEKREKCQMSGGAFKITAWHSVKGCNAITTAILERPLCVMVNAVYWQHYNSGIFTECQNKSEPNFETFLVGVTSDYWKFKNAWGPKWGENGYIRLAINNPCGICYMKTTWAV